MEETKRESLDQMFAQLEEVAGKMEGEEISLEE